MSYLIIIIHAYQNPDDLRRCLKSLNDTLYMKTNDVLIVDNSFEEWAKKANSEIAGQFKNFNINYLGQAEWELFVSSSALITQQEKNVLSASVLGEKGWSTHHSRNVGMMYAYHMYPDAKYSFNLDQDIILPRDIKIDMMSGDILGCTQISGCPDLSRLEWIGFYQIYLTKILNVPLQRYAADYAWRMAHENEFSVVENIVNTYTDFKTEALLPGSLDQVINFVQREEYYGACYVSLTGNAKTMVPKWYDNDWFFFRQTRQNKDVVKFLPACVHHASVRKTINNKYGYEVEEYGKIVNDIFDMIAENGEFQQDMFEQAIAKRLVIIDGELEINKRLRDADTSRKYAVCLDDIRSHIIHLKEYVVSLRADEILKDISAYSDVAGFWKSAVSEANARGQSQDAA